MVQAVTEPFVPKVPARAGFGELPRRPSQQAAKLARELGKSLTLSDWLERRGYLGADLAQRFLSPRLSELSVPDGMAGRGPAADRLASAIRRGERIAVFGDYDCDGMTSAAILTEILRELGATVSALVASRFDGGYGVSHSAVKRLIATGASLVVTCDCGSSDHETLAVLVARGIDVIVVDHHLVPDEPLPALAFLNPHQADCGFAYKGLASCGLVFSLGAALRKVLGKQLDLRRWLDLVAVGTIADVAPLDGDNRALVRAGLRALGEAHRPGIRALMEHAKLDVGVALTAEDVAFRIAPRLNAPGRLGAPDPALEILMAPTFDVACSLAARIEQASIERRALTDRVLAEALEEVRRERYDECPAIVLGREGWGHGIVGIVAGRLCDRFHRPVVVFGFEGERGRGSVRGPAGSRLHDALCLSAAALVRFGGHQAAAGAEIELSRLGEFREAFSAAIASAAGGGVAALPCTRDLLWLSEEDDPEVVVADFGLLEPCGMTNPAPELLIDAKVLAAREVTGGHLKLELELRSGRRLAAFGVEMGGRAAGLTGSILVSGRLRPDRFRGGTAVELRLEKIF